MDYINAYFKSDIGKQSLANTHTERTKIRGCVK